MKSEQKRIQSYELACVIERMIMKSGSTSTIRIIQNRKRCTGDNFYYQKNRSNWKNFMTLKDWKGKLEINAQAQFDLTPKI